MVSLVNQRRNSRREQEPHGEAMASKREAKYEEWMKRFLELTKSRKHTAKKAYAIIAKSESRDRDGNRPTAIVVERAIKSMKKQMKKEQDSE